MIIMGSHKGQGNVTVGSPVALGLRGGPSLGCLPVHWQFGLVPGLVHVLVAGCPPLPGGLGPLLDVAVGPPPLVAVGRLVLSGDPGQGLGLSQLEQVAIEKRCEDLVVVVPVVVHVRGGASGGEDGALMSSVSSTDVSLGWVDCHLKVSGCMWRSWRHPRG